MLRRPSILAALAVAILWLCQFLTVRYNYQGNWTGLFCIAPHMPVPEFLRSEKLYIFANTDGYDGQIFHLIAHDPWMTRGSAAAIYEAEFRYQRIFVPALAWLLALGQDEYVHAAYFALILISAFAGVFWLAQSARTRGWHPAWGLLFAATPATITSADRMTADIALAAFCVGFALYAAAGPSWRVIAILACAALTRETTVPIAAGYCLFLVTQKQLFWATSVLCSMLPAGAWFLYVTHGAARSHAVSYLNPVPFYGLAERVIHPATYALGPWKSAVAVLFDYVALAGIALVFIAIAKIARARRWDPVASAIYPLALMVVLLGSRDVWQDAYNFGRVLSPLLVLAFLEQFPRGPSAAFAPMALVDLRISLNLAGELEGVVRGLLK